MIEGPYERGVAVDFNTPGSGTSSAHICLHYCCTSMNRWRQTNRQLLPSLSAWLSLGLLVTAMALPICVPQHTREFSVANTEQER